MRGDFSRSTFDPAAHRRDVLWQRGRVIVDADWNEAVEIQLRRLETLAADLVGPAGGPLLGAFGALEIAAPGGVPSLRSGHFYVEGVLAEVEADVALTAQPDLPGYTLPAAAGRYLAYLDVWEEPIGRLESPELPDPALGGEETAVRGRVLAQARLFKVEDTATPAHFRPGWSPRPEPALRLEVRTLGTPANNQLYRIEVHEGGGLGAASWTWSRDNATVMAAVTGVAGTDLTVALPPAADAERLFPPGAWIEATSRGRSLRSEPGVLARLLAVTPGPSPVLTVESWPGGVPPTDVDRAVRWDSAGALPLAVPTVNGGFFTLEEGLEVRFSAEAGARVETGDHWLVPLRAAAGALGGEAARAPDGSRHRYAPLQLLDRTGAGWLVVAGGDCRRLFDRAGALDLSNKVDRSGDTRSGPLTIASHLFVTGQTKVGAVSTGSTARLQVGGRGTLLAAGSSLGFPDLGGVTAALGFVAGSLRLEVAGVGGSLRLSQNGADRIVLSGGRVGIGTVSPQVDVEIAGTLRATDLRVTSDLAIVDGSQGAGRVLTATDANGQATWQTVPEQQVVRPIFFQSPVVVAAGSSGNISFADYSFLAATLPAGAKAVILEGMGVAAGPDSGAIDHYLRIRLDSSDDWRLLLLGRAAGGGDSSSWASQGVFPVNATAPHFQYSVRAFGGDNGDPGAVGSAFPGGWRIRAIGYFL